MWLQPEHFGTVFKYLFPRGKRDANSKPEPRTRTKHPTLKPNLRTRSPTPQPRNPNLRIRAQHPNRRSRTFELRTQHRVHITLESRSLNFKLNTVCTSTTQQLNNSTTQQLNNSTTQQLNNSTTQQLNNSTTQQLNNSTTQLSKLEAVLYSQLASCCSTALSTSALNLAKAGQYAFIVRQTSTSVASGVAAC